MRRGRFFTALAFCLVGIAILFSLGTWQLQRLHWKEGLIAAIDRRIHAAPADLATIESRLSAGQPVDYTPVTISGRFRNAEERYFLSTFEGEAGWNVYTPLVLDGGDVVFVNRGFVPYALREPARRSAGLPSGPVTVTGLVRIPPAQKPDYFTPDNAPEKAEFYWQDLAAMGQGVAIPPGGRLLPFFVDAGPGRAEGGWPVGGVTVVSLPNDHLQYAITWYGLCLVLVVMTGLMVVRRFRRRG
ncbi:SURF1 family protein [Jiella sonneratiae]|uniref:SURF1-like protein n=1 Tax=Jiella sonneratiae TaxID=2816856 RepID=A0ABS3J4I4_9HYPH|nr:SURF1 family protein [Jiella sonneratiae]MBO0904588.1 SURF1 family protein [Jiella sonneratiae]